MITPMAMQRYQGGTTLIIALIFLVILTLFAVSGVNTGITNLRAANSAQMVVEAEAAAQQQVEQMLNSMTNFANAAAVPAEAPTNLDVNGDGINDFVVTTKRPRCLSIKAAPGYEYDLTPSAPKDTVWEVVANASDAVFGATVTLRQGVKIRMPVGSGCVNP